MPEHILDSILAESRAVLPELRRQRPAFEAAAAARPPAPEWVRSLRRDDVAVIAEVKRRSPSRGALDEAVDTIALARTYSAGGAAAISVLTQESRFGGSIEVLRDIADAVRAPLLRKDFIVDEVQLLEARAAGAAAALLIVRALEPQVLAQLIAFASGIGLGTLVEAHTAAEIAVAVDSGAEVIGVNARDLDTLQIDTDHAWRMLERVPASLVAVAESGLNDRTDVAAAADAGADAVLVGTALVLASDRLGAVRQLTGVKRRGR